MRIRVASIKKAGATLGITVYVCSQVPMKEGVGKGPHLGNLEKSRP